jgi:acyl carrier protein
MAEEYMALVIEVVRPFLENDMDLNESSPLENQIDSMAMVQIILALESRIGRPFGPTDIQFDHFESVGSLARQLSLIASHP